MALTAYEAVKRYRLRKKGIYVESIPSWARGHKQTDEHIKKRIRLGPDHYNWSGDNVSAKAGRSRAKRYFTIQPCEKCGEDNKRIDRHHKDGNTSNNENSNIGFLCRKCHMKEDGRFDKFLEMVREPKNAKN